MSALGYGREATAELVQFERSREAILEDDVRLAEKGSMPGGGEAAEEEVVDGKAEVEEALFEGVSGKNCLSLDGE